MQQAVLEFDEAVQVPWRPPLASRSARAARLRRSAGAALAAVPGQGAVPRMAGTSGSACSAGSGRPRGAAVCRVPDAGGPVPHIVGRRGGSGGPDRRSGDDGPDRRSGDDGPGRQAGDGGRSSERRGGAPVRLTRRGRRLLVVASLAAGIALGSWLGPLVGGDSGDLRLAGHSRVVVQSGDTLWSIAASAAAGEDVRTVVDRIQELNRLEDATVRPGQVLLLP